MTEPANDDTKTKGARKVPVYKIARDAGGADDALFDAAREQIVREGGRDLAISTVLREGLRAIVDRAEVRMQRLGYRAAIEEVCEGRAPDLPILAVRFDALRLRCAMLTAGDDAAAIEEALSLARGTVRNVLVGRVALAGAGGGTLLAYVASHEAGGVAP